MKLQAVFDDVARIRSAKKLCAYAFDHYGAMLSEDNGLTWLRRKISYLAYDKLKGPLTGRAKERMDALDTAAKIRELKLEDKERGDV